ncbi:MAG: acyl-CoA dehydrogenase family protein [Anaerolineae bacterium]|nr:acyl-CoA dehydrogenase family protein [Anaerolineae bacterium]
MTTAAKPLNAAVAGRGKLLAWEDGKPKNFFTANVNLQYVLRRYLGAEAYSAAEANLRALGAQAATTLDQAAKLEDRIGNHPRLERWSDLGERIEQIEFHPNHDVAGELIWGSGILSLQAEPGRTVEQMGLYYLITHNGEAGHMCSLACTSGLIRALQQAADEATQQQFLPPLLDSDYEAMQHGAQFLTEVQGGSDVGANAVTATQSRDGTWRINGEKWFCSNINADQFLMTARATNRDGTRGLGLFLVPRTLQDGSTNGFYIRRLKDKLGTRTLASAELDFVDCVAYAVGAVEEGFKNVVSLVLNTSRLMNAIACAGAIHRSFIEAGTYACYREAFGTAIASYPMVQEAVADLLSESYAATASTFYIAHLLDKIETGQASPEEAQAYRFLVNVNKYITAIRATEMIHRGIEVLGGNGAIESFSILPRLYRDAVVLESWEGTHNVLAVQVLRDISRYGIHQGFLAEMGKQLATVTHVDLQKSAAIVRDAMQRFTQLLAKMQQGGFYAQAHARRLIDEAGWLAQGVLLLAEAQWELDEGLSTHKPDVAQYFILHNLQPGYDPMDDQGYLALLEHLMAVV